MMTTNLIVWIKILKCDVFISMNSTTDALDATDPFTCFHNFGGHQTECHASALVSVLLNVLF